MTSNVAKSFMTLCGSPSAEVGFRLRVAGNLELWFQIHHVLRRYSKKFAFRASTIVLEHETKGMLVETMGS